MRAGEDAENQKIVFPRRWVDLSGDLVSSTWKAAMRAVVGQLLFRPTINHVSIVPSSAKRLPLLRTQR